MKPTYKYILYIHVYETYNYEANMYICKYENETSIYNNEAIYLQLNFQPLRLPLFQVSQEKKQKQENSGKGTPPDALALPRATARVPSLHRF